MNSSFASWKLGSLRSQRASLTTSACTYWLSTRMEPTKTKLVEFGRFAQRHAAKHGRKRPETIYFRGFTLYCTRNLKGNFRIGMRTEKSRLRRSLMSLQDLLRRIRHLSVREQVNTLNAALRGHYAYYGIAGSFRSLQKVHRAVERYWHKMPLRPGLGISFRNHTVGCLGFKRHDVIERSQGFGVPSACAMKKVTNIDRPAVVRIETQRSLHGALCPGQFHAKFEGTTGAD